jgi:hypothetical protein
MGMSDYSERKLLCCMKEMEYCAGDSDDNGCYEEWLECKQCGHILGFEEAEKVLEKRYGKRLQNN